MSASVLLVEDDELVRPTIEDVLSEGGFEVRLAMNGAEAISPLDSHRDTIRALLTDINLARGPDGWDVARHGRELIPELPIVHMSGGNAHQWTAQGIPKSILVAKPSPWRKSSRPYPC